MNPLELQVLAIVAGVPVETGIQPEETQPLRRLVQRRFCDPRQVFRRFAGGDGRFLARFAAT